MPPFNRDEIVALKIDSAAFEGKGIARVDGYVVFVSGGVPGDLVNARILKAKRDFAEAKVTEVVRPSPSRVTAPCRYFGICGGCRWQHFDYLEQTRFKRQHVVDALERTAGIKVNVAETVIADATYAYRNKIEMTFSENPFRIHEGDPVKVALGFHAPARFDKTIDIDRCYLADEKTNAVVDWFRKAISPDSLLRKEIGLTIYDSKAHAGLLRFLTIRRSFSSDELMVSLVILSEDDSVEKLAEKLHEDLPFVSTFASIINRERAQIANGDIWKIHFGRGFITEKLGGYSFRISPLSFFQTNTRQAEKLYAAALNGVRGKHKVIYDMYSGTGSLAIYMSRQADQLYGFEVVASSVEDANANARLNDVTNIEFVRSDLLELFKGPDVKSNFSQRGIPLPDLVLLDPPRSGLHPKIASALHLLGADRIIYVSCNPITQARDVKEIVSHGYRAVSSQPVDMFPQTYHIENVLVMERI